MKLWCGTDLCNLSSFEDQGGGGEGSTQAAGKLACTRSSICASKGHACSPPHFCGPALNGSRPSSGPWTGGQGPQGWKVNVILSNFGNHFQNPEQCTSLQSHNHVHDSITIFDSILVCNISKKKPKKKQPYSDNKKVMCKFSLVNVLREDIQKAQKYHRME